MNKAERRNQIIAMLYQNMDKADADETLKLVDDYADEQNEKVQCKTCGKDFHIEATVMHWDTGRRQCVKCYADEQSREAFIAGANAIGLGLPEIIERKADEYLSNQEEKK